MTIISNSFAPTCLYLPPKYTISTLQFVNIADNQDGYGCIWKFIRFIKAVRAFDLGYWRGKEMRKVAPGASGSGSSENRQPWLLRISATNISPRPWPPVFEV